MPVIQIYTDNADDYIESGPDASYLTTCDGTSLAVAGSGVGNLVAGQAQDGSSNYYAYMFFVKMDLTPYTGTVDSDATLRFVHDGTGGTIGGWEPTFRIKTYNWGASVDTGDWRTTGQSAALSNLASGIVAHQVAGSVTTFSIPKANIVLGAMNYFLVTTNLVENALNGGLTPGSSNKVIFYSGNDATQTNRPRLDVTYTPSQSAGLFMAALTG